MKKLIALLLAAVLLLGCTAAIAEEIRIESEDGVFTLSFQLPEGAEMLSGEWIDSTRYLANLKAGDDLYFYLAVSAPAAEETENAEELSPVTYNEENGYTDAYMEEMLRGLYADDSDDFELGVKTTAYGTKLAIVRFNDLSAPSAYVFTVWNDFEVGLTVASIDAEEHFHPITDEQLEKVVDFVSELWMTKPAAE